VIWVHVWPDRYQSLKTCTTIIPICPNLRCRLTAVEASQRPPLQLQRSKKKSDLPASCQLTVRAVLSVMHLRLHAIISLVSVVNGWRWTSNNLRTPVPLQAPHLWYLEILHCKASCWPRPIALQAQLRWDTLA
jgi:hypothetical protein